jgi:hypothetical protein
MLEGNGICDGPGILDIIGRRDARMDVYISNSFNYLKE